MSSEYQREYLVRLPLPLAQLYDRAHNAKDARARYDNTFYLFEALIKLAAAPAIACYLHEVGQGATRSKVLDRVLAQLALPSLGQWVGMLRELARHFGHLPDASSHPLGHLWDQLDKARHDRPALLALYRRIKHGADGEPGGDQSCSLLNVFDALVQYRNDVIGHGGPRFDSFFTDEMGPLLFPAANEILAEGTFDPLGPRGSRLVYVNAELRQLDEDRVEVGLRELIGKDGERAAPLPLGRSEAAALAGRVAVIWPGRAIPLRLDPLLLYREGERSSDMLFLNRDLNGRQVQYLNYSTGRTERDRSTASALAALLSRITGREVSEAQLEALAEQSRAATPSVESLFGPTEPVSRVLGGYEILAEIGRGGMGVVFLARQLSLGRLVALKMLPADLAGDEVALARFRRELRLLARCEHPNIVMILDSGTMPDGQLYYAMEYIPGCNLDQVWRELPGSDHPGDASTLGGSSWNQAVHSASRKAREQATRRPQSASPDANSPEPPILPLPPLPDLPSVSDDPGGYTRRVVMLVRDVARALQAIHDQDIIHRDVKPGNLMLTPDGSRVVLMDFGLAKGQTLDALSKGTGGLLGTLRYAAPEQLAAARLKVGPTADVRGLGVVLWELLTRRRLFDEAEDEVGLTDRIIYQEVPALRTIYPAFDRDLEAIVARSTERRAADRIATAGKLAEYLQLYLDGKPLPIRLPTTGEMLGRWSRAHKPLISSVAIAMLAILVTISMAFVLISKSKNDAVRSRNDAKDEAKKAGKLASDNELLARNEAKSREIAEERLKHVEHSSYNLQLNKAIELLRKDPVAASQLLDDVDAFPASMRDFAWGYYRRLAPPLREPIELDRFPVCSTVYSPDGETIAAAATDNTIKVWSLDPVKPLITYSGHQFPVRSIDFSPDGEILASGSNDETVRLWGQRQSVLKDHKGRVLCVKFAPDGESLASAGDDGVIRVWELSTSTIKVRLEGHAAAVNSIVFSPDGQIVASAGADKTVRLWDPVSGKQRLSLTGHNGNVKSLAFSSNGAILASAEDGGEILIWDVDTGNLRAKLPGQTRALETFVSFVPDKEILISFVDSQGVMAWDLSREQPTPLFKTSDVNKTRILSLAVSPDGDEIATSRDNGYVVFFDSLTGEESRKAIGTHAPFIRSTLVVPITGHLVLHLSDGTIELRKSPKGERLALLRDPEGPIDGMRLSPNGLTLASYVDVNSLRLWDVASGRERALIRGEKDFCKALRFSPDGQMIATGNGGGTIQLWDVRTGAELLKLQGNSGEVRTLIFSPDGRTLAWDVEGRLLNLWDLAKGQARDLKLKNQGFMNTDLHGFSPDGKTLSMIVSQGYSGFNSRLLMIDVETGSERHAFEGDFTFGGPSKFSTDSKYLVATDLEHNTHIWEVETGIEQFQIAAGTSSQSPTKVGFSQDGKTLIILDKAAESIDLWDLEQKRKRATLVANSKVYSSYAVLSSDGRTLATSGAVVNTSKPSTRIWDTATGTLVTEYMGIGGGEVNFSPDGRTVYSNGYGGVHVLDAFNYPEKVTCRGHSGSVHGLAFSPDGRTLASAGEDSAIKFWDVKNKTVLATILGSEETIARLAFSPDGTTLVSSGEDKMIRIWDLKTGWEKRSLSGHEGTAYDLLFTPDGRTLITSDEADVILWDVESGRRRATIKSHEGKMYGVALSPDGRTLATSGIDGTIRFWDPTTALETRTFIQQRGEVSFLAFTPDGTRLAWEFEGRKLRLSDVATGREMAVLRQAANEYRGPRFLQSVFSPDGKTLATISGEKAIGLWDTVTGQQRAILNAHEGNISALIFSPDGRTLVSADYDHAIHFWETGETYAPAIPRTIGPRTETVSTHKPEPVAFSLAPNLERERYVDAALKNRSRSRHLERDLRLPLDFFFSVETPLEDVLKYVKDATQDEDSGAMTILVDFVGLQEADRTTASPIVASFEEKAPLSRRLKTALESIGLTYEVDEMVLVITKKGSREKPPTLPPIWSSDPDTRAILVELEQTVPIPFSKLTPLEDVLTHIKSSTKSPRFPNGIPIKIDPQVLGAVEVTMASPVMLELDRVPLRLSLRYLLSFLGLSYQVTSGEIRIVALPEVNAK